MPIFLWSAAAVSALGFYIHTFIGGKNIARPLLEDTGLPPASKWLNYYCWHITTVLLAFLTITFLILPHIKEQVPLIIFLSALTASLSILSAVIERKAKARPLRFPSTSLFAGISAFGWLSVFTA